MTVTFGLGVGPDRDIMMTIEPDHNNTVFLPPRTSCCLIDMSVRDLAVRLLESETGIIMNPDAGSEFVRLCNY